MRPVTDAEEPRPQASPILGIGVDPDLHRTGLALIGLGRVIAVDCARVSQNMRGREAAAAMAGQILVSLRSLVSFGPEVPCYYSFTVEAPQVNLRRTKNPQDIVHLALVAGAAAAAASMLPGLGATLTLPYPKNWKGDVPKGIAQARLYEHLAWPYELREPAGSSYCVPTEVPEDVARPEGLCGLDWKQVGDAIGLASWGLAEIAKKRESLGTMLDEEGRRLEPGPS